MIGLVYFSITLSIFLYVIGFVILFRYKRDKIKYIDEQLEAINNILDTCDNMVHELNNLSDYITTNIEDKSLMLKELLSEVDRKIKYLDSQVNYISSSRSTKKKKEADSEKSENKLEQTGSKGKVTSNEKMLIKPASSIIDAYEKNLNMIKDLEKNEDRKPKYLSDKVIIDNIINSEIKKPDFFINPKEKEIIELSKQGLDTTEIAKKLGMGKGEIELILELKNSEKNLS